MDLRKMMVVCAVALSGLAVGCKSDCEKVCEDSKDCSGATAETKATDCSKSCDDADKAADQIGCKSELDDLFSCASDNDVCSTSDQAKCTSQAAALLSCESKYCTAHPDDADCSASGIP